MDDGAFDLDKANENCTTTDSFADHDIEDGSALIAQAYYSLVNADEATFEPTETFFDRLEEAVLWAYLGRVEEPGVPDHVAAALNDARALTFEEFAERPEADLRTEVLSFYYRQAAGFHCAYRS